MNLGIRADVKRLFFDRKVVEDAVSRAEKNVLSKAGAYVRRTARSSIKRSKKSAAPGQPPRSHVGLLKEGIFFAFEPADRSVVIGPVLLNRGSGQVPHLMEFGGVGPEGAAYAPHPFMGPALEKNAPEFPKLFANSVHR